MCRERVVCGSAGAGAMVDAGEGLALWCVRVVSLQRLCAAVWAAAAAHVVVVAVVVGGSAWAAGGRARRVAWLRTYRAAYPVRTVLWCVADMYVLRCHVVCCAAQPRTAVNASCQVACGRSVWLEGSMVWIELYPACHHVASGFCMCSWSR